MMGKINALNSSRDYIPTVDTTAPRYLSLKLKVIRVDYKTAVSSAQELESSFIL